MCEVKSFHLKGHIYYFNDRMLLLTLTCKMIPEALGDSSAIPMSENYNCNDPLVCPHLYGESLVKSSGILKP